MSNNAGQENFYSTGEVAKLCDVSVRTVQYYDTRGILVPSQLSEGGRRLYTEADLQKMRVICFLREAGMSIGNISQMFEDKDTNSAEVVSILVDQQMKVLREEMDERKNQLEKLKLVRQAVSRVEHFSVESIGDIAHMMKNKKQMRRFRVNMLISAALVEALEVGTIVLWASTGIWWPYVAIGLPVVVAYALGLSLAYHRKIAYICPSCHQVFKPTFKQIFLAPHTPTTRKLTCSCCAYRGYCVETYAPHA